MSPHVGYLIAGKTVLNNGGVFVDTNGQQFVVRYGDGARRAPFLVGQPCPAPASASASGASPGTATATAIIPPPSRIRFACTPLVLLPSYAALRAAITAARALIAARAVAAPTCLGLTTEARMREMHVARMQVYQDLMKMLQQTEERLEARFEALGASLEAVPDHIPMRVYNSEEVKATWLAQARRRPSTAPPVPHHHHSRRSSYTTPAGQMSPHVGYLIAGKTVLNNGGVFVDTNGQHFVVRYGDGARRAPFLLGQPCPRPCLCLRLWRQPRHRNRHRNRHRHHTPTIAHQIRLHAARAAAVACRTRAAIIAVRAVPSPPRAARARLLFVP
ncbi:hypothetical protein JKP88DRAFT_254630 [Tribonema minus]|uniref:Uncharacterized protein n=1 Tax=Tribonema minus TaxID=303371 RepID=A0A836CJP4_9STRA|nr:hypothetical protein JKP88DRAFT_254630 [Tribonema minus]